MKFLNLYAQSIDELFYNGITFSGDGYFNKIDKWISDNLKADNPRSAKLDPEDVIGILDNPAFEFLSTTPEIKTVRSRIERAIAELNSKKTSMEIKI